MGVRVRQRNGAWWVFINHKGRRKAKRVGDKKAAELAATKIRARLALGDHALLEEERRDLTLQEATEQWLTTHLQLGQIRASTHADYSCALRLHAYPRIGSKPVAGITREDMRSLVVGLLSQ